MPAFLVVFAAFLLGLALGSFASMASWRLPRRIGWGGRSFCDSCGRILGVRDLVPVLTWLVRRGKCACGLQKVSVRYPLIELAMGTACALAAWRYGISLQTLLLCVLATVLTILVTVEAETRTLPLSLVGVSTGLAVLQVFLAGLSLQALLAGVTVWVVLSLGLTAILFCLRHFSLRMLFSLPVVLALYACLLAGDAFWSITFW
ncbi:MAG: prepilin peptidase [Pseudomonadota bacterium]|nr:prepilin peptidase [Pseudomonadota bacterium]